VTLSGWQGKCRSGVALAMRHRLSGLSIYGLNGHRKGDQHPAYASCTVLLLYRKHCKYRLNTVSQTRGPTDGLPPSASIHIRRSVAAARIHRRPSVVAATHPGDYTRCQPRVHSTPVCPERVCHCLPLPLPLRLAVVKCAENGRPKMKWMTQFQI